MPHPLAFLILPHGDSAGLSRTLDSLRAEAGPEVTIYGLPGGSLTPTTLSAAAVEPVSGVEDLAAAGLVAPIRPGDELVPGALGPRVKTFLAYPGAGISIASHTLVDHTGNELRLVKPPPPGFDPDDLLLRARTEPAATLIRSESISESNLELLAQPHGDLIAISRIAHDHGYHLSGETAARVRIDSERHGTDPAAPASSLISAIRTSGGPDRSGQSAMRRDLLRRLYLEPAGETVQAPSLATLFSEKLSDPEAAAAVVADLQWLAERQAEALRLERLRWTEGEVKIEDAPPLTVSEEIRQAHATVGEVGAKTHHLNTVVSRLHNQLYHREVVISHLTGAPLPEARAMAEAEENGDGEASDE